MPTKTDVRRRKSKGLLRRCRRVPRLATPTALRSQQVAESSVTPILTITAFPTSSRFTDVDLNRLGKFTGKKRREPNFTAATALSTCRAGAKRPAAAATSARCPSPFAAQ